MPQRSLEGALLHSEAAAVARSAKRLDAYVTGALRARVWDARRVLAYGIDPDVSLEQFLARARAAGPRRAAAEATARTSALVPDGLTGAWWRGLARVIALQGLDSSDLSDGLLLHEVAREIAPVSTWPARDALTLSQLLWKTGQCDRLRHDEELLGALDPEARAALHADLVADQHGVGSPEWETAVTELLEAHGVPGVTTQGGATPFDGLRAVQMPDPVDGPLVSVIMSAFKPGPEIMTSVRSILDQSWNNLELLVVDDASGPAYKGILDQVASLDPRVRVLVQSVNRGTYSARNRALTEARGEFLTFQDSDDWSHPERIARQAGKMLADSALPAVMSRSVRCTPELEMQYLGYMSCRPNVSSLMLRRSTFEALGYFDHVRKGADSEYELRIQAYFGRRVPVMPDVLAFVRLDPDSLSRSDFKPGWWHPARHAYRDAYRRWHRTLHSGGDPRLEREGNKRRFPAPRAFLRATEHRIDDRPFDVVLAADWREVGGTQASLLQQAQALTEQGRRVGVLHLESLRALDCRVDGLALEICDLIFSGAVSQVLPDDAVTIETLVLGDPALLNHPRDGETAFEVRRVAILAAEPPQRSVGNHHYAPDAVTALAERTWRAPVVWIPANGLVRASLEASPSLQLAASDLPGHFAPATASSPPARHSAPVVGAPLGLGEDGLRASPEELRALFPDDTRFDIRLIASPPRLSSILRVIPRHWLVFRPDEITQQTLYRQLDFFVSPSGPGRDEQVVPRVIDAVSAGAVAIVPPTYEDILGDAAVYAEPGSVAETVMHLFTNPGHRAVALERARTTLRGRFGRTILDAIPFPLDKANGAKR